MATGVAIAATVLQIAWIRYRTGKVEPMHWVSLGVVVLFGGATIVLHDDTFIKWKPTVLYWLMAVTLAAASSIFRKNLLKTLMGSQLEAAGARLAPAPTGAGSCSSPSWAWPTCGWRSTSAPTPGSTSSSSAACA